MCNFISLNIFLLNNWVLIIDKLYNCTSLIHLPVILLLSCGKHYCYGSPRISFSQIAGNPNFPVGISDTGQHVSGNGFCWPPVGQLMLEKVVTYKMFPYILKQKNIWFSMGGHVRWLLHILGVFYPVLSSGISILYKHYLGKSYIKETLEMKTMTTTLDMIGFFGNKWYDLTVYHTLRKIWMLTT